MILPFVVSCEYPFDIDKLSDLNDSSFGRIVLQLSDRRKVTTDDIVCVSYCIKNEATGYPGFVANAPPSNKPTSNRACDYYTNLYDSTQPYQIHNLAWGFDGYTLSACDVNVSITVEDLRICGKGRINRKILVPGPTGVMVTTTQTIWIVDCDDANPSINIIIDTSGIPANGFADIHLNVEVENHCYPADQTLLTYEIDEFNDSNGIYPGGFDYKVGPLSLKDYAAGNDPQFMDNPRAFDSRNPGDASGRYPIGKHKIKWTVEDTCGTLHSVSEIFEIKETVRTKNIAADQIVLMIPNPSNGSVLISSKQEIDIIRLTSSTGVLYQKYIVSDKHHLKLEQLKPGMYFVQTFTNGVLNSSGKLLVF